MNRKNLFKYLRFLFPPVFLKKAMRLNVLLFLGFIFGSSANGMMAQDPLAENINYNIPYKKVRDIQILKVCWDQLKMKGGGYVKVGSSEYNTITLPKNIEAISNIPLSTLSSSGILLGEDASDKFFSVIKPFELTTSQAHNELPLLFHEPYRSLPHQFYRLAATEKKNIEVSFSIFSESDLAMLYSGAFKDVRVQNRLSREVKIVGMAIAMLMLAALLYSLLGARMRSGAWLLGGAHGVRLGTTDPAMVSALLKGADPEWAMRSKVSDVFLYSLLGNCYHLGEHEQFIATVQEVVVRNRIVHIIANVDVDVLDTAFGEHILIPKGSKLIGLYVIEEDDINIYWHHMHQPAEGSFNKEFWLENVVSVTDLLDNDIISPMNDKHSLYLQTQFVFPGGDTQTPPANKKDLFKRLLGSQIVVTITMDMFFSGDSAK